MKEKLLCVNLWGVLIDDLECFLGDHQIFKLFTLTSSSAPRKFYRETFV